VLVCTANPAAGRTVVDGVVRINGVPLDRTDFRHDPIWPALTGSIPALLCTQGSAAAAQWRLDDLRSGRCRLAAETGPAEPPRIIIADAETTADLAMVAQAAAAAAAGTVFAGSSAFALALACTWPAAEALPLVLPPVARGCLVVCGSRHPASRQQLDRLQRDGTCPVFLLSGAGGEVDGMRERVGPALERGAAAIGLAAPAGAERDPRQLLALIAAAAVKVIDACPVELVYLTGGETAAAVCRGCRVRTLEIGAELDPGVARCLARREHGRPMQLVTKPGGYGAADSIQRTLHALMK
jgi:D-threonate/D-erythronate kinase